MKAAAAASAFILGADVERALLTFWTGAVMAPSVREVQLEMEKMRELLRRVLGVSSISADISDVISLLLKGLRDPELKCPKLMCHLHVSGVS